MILLNKFLGCNARDAYLSKYYRSSIRLIVGYTTFKYSPIIKEKCFNFKSNRYPYTINERGRLTYLTYEKNYLSVAVNFNSGEPRLHYLNRRDPDMMPSFDLFSFRYSDVNIKMIISEWAKN